MKAVLAVAALLFPGAALAHPGGHSGFSVGTLVAHISRQPDHAALVQVALALGAALFWRAWSRK